MIEIERFLEGAKQMFTIGNAQFWTKTPIFKTEKFDFQVEIADSSHKKFEKGIFLIEIVTF